MKKFTSYNILNSSGNEINDFINKSLIGSHQKGMDSIDKNFINDALEGYKQNPEAIKHLPELNIQINKKFLFNKLIAKKIFFSLFSVMTIAAVVLTSIFLFKNKNAVSQVKLKETFSKKSIKEAVIDHPFSFDYENQIKFINALNKQSQDEYLTRKKNVESIEKLITLGPSEVIIPEDKFISSRDVSLLYYTVSNYPLTFIRDLKTVDYSKFRSSIISYPNIYPGGLSPAYSNYEDKKNDLIEKTEILIPYKDFLNRALKKFTDQDYSEAIYDFELILEQYKNDVNACFYAGLSFYFLGKYDKAIEYLDLAVYNTVNSFDQEAEWYKALAMINKKDIRNAKKILKTIIDKGSFYSSRASEKLKEIS